MTWVRWIIVVLAVVDASYMTIDGMHALTSGDYFTPSSGEHAGELGPWARIVKAVGIEPRSTGMKTAFVVYGLAWLAVAVLFALKYSWAWAAMLVMAVGSLWYLTIGTVISIVITILLFLPSIRDIYDP